MEYFAVIRGEPSAAGGLSAYADGSEPSSDLSKRFGDRLAVCLGVVEEEVASQEHLLCFGQLLEKGHGHHLHQAV
jgi:hypothetical protein